jgi:hypothetical protein
MAKQTLQKIVPEHEKFYYKLIFSRLKHRFVGHQLAYVVRKVRLSSLATYMHTITFPADSYTLWNLDEPYMEIYDPNVNTK